MDARLHGPRFPIALAAALVAAAALAPAALRGCSADAGFRLPFLRTPRPRFDRMTVHHTASDSRQAGRRVDAERIASWHRARGLGRGYGDARDCAYHYIILPDGTVQTGRPLGLSGSGTRSAEDNRCSLGVVLVGDFSSAHNRGRFQPARPTAAQLEALRGVALWACDEYGFGPERVHGHREVSASDCPGDRLDMSAFREAIRQARLSGVGGRRPMRTR